ncbi:MAG: FAD-dependent oxidoreductase [Blautia sp.]|jgi:glycine/D-amino acid oxidase-like deaminating enzyme/nitrite reductase/ring-hydroxylating ferredoxin subunit
MESIWRQGCKIRHREELEGEISCDTAVIGAGMAGILTAYKLQQAGQRVAVLEAGRIAGGQTENTTAKITSQHGLIYRKLMEKEGEEKAWQYAMANEAAVGQYRNIIEKEGIFCDFEETDAYVYGNDREKLMAEAQAAARLGLPAAFVRDVPVPVPSEGGVRFSHQAQFHPLKFVQALAEKLTIYENTQVRRVESHQLVTDRGQVNAGKIVFACHYPFVDFPGMYFARMHQERSYVLALANAPRLGGMFIGAEKGSYSFRDFHGYLLFGGENHRTGENSKGGRYEALEKKAKELFPGCRPAARWSAQDCMTLDEIPYIGNYAAKEPDWYVATGFQKWGMSTSMAAAMILRDMICGKRNPYQQVFDPGRFSLDLVPRMAEEGKQAVKGLARRFFQDPEETAAGIFKGHGGIVDLDGEKVGVYKDTDGRIYGVDIRCPHLGCELEWNPDEKSWDCPCHGSRFDYQGRVLAGPAQEGAGLE